MGTVPVDANAAVFFQAVDQALGEGMKRMGDEWQRIYSSWSGGASNAFQRVVTDWHTAYAGLFGDVYTQQPGVIGEIARRMGVHWYDHTMPVTQYGVPPAAGAYQTTIGQATLSQTTAADGTTSLSVSGDPNQTGDGGLVALHRSAMLEAPAIPAADPWQQGGEYAAGQQVTYGGHTYVCRQSHTAYADNWTPSATADLWRPVT